MFDASGPGTQPKKANCEELLKVEDSLRFLENSFRNAENTEASSLIRLIADRVANIQEDVEAQERQQGILK